MTLAALWPLELARPGALLALLLPLIVLLRSRASDRPAVVATGTLDLWERVLRRRPPSSLRTRARIPPAVWILALGLALGAIALAGPRLPTTAEPRAFRVLVDRSPSMELPLGAETRRERAVSMARAWLEREEPGARAEWIDRREPFAPEDDAPDVLWVTDRAPSPRPERAGFFASGGPAVHGPIAVEGSTRYDWDGERIVAVEDGAPARGVETSGELPGPIARMLAAWAEARGARMAAGDGRPALVVAAPVPSAPPLREVEIGRDGWTAHGYARVAAPGTGGTWLADAQGVPLVTFAPGRIDCALAAMDEPRGDPAAFAVSWGALFDRAILAPEGVIELGERLAAGEERIQPPQESGGEERATGPRAWDAWLAAASLACALLALGFARSFRIE